MKDLDQFVLKELAGNPEHHYSFGRDTVVLVPLDLLVRVTNDFEVEHVRGELRGRCRH